MCNAMWWSPPNSAAVADFIECDRRLWIGMELSLRAYQARTRIPITADSIWKPCPLRLLPRPREPVYDPSRKRMRPRPGPPVRDAQVPE